ncbi:MAG: SIS domain-containing protein [Sulfobacillus sp.]
MSAAVYVNQVMRLASRLDYDVVDRVLKAIDDACTRGATIAIGGNGGSAGTAAHVVADISLGTWTRQTDKAPLVFSLAERVALASALANDRSPEDAFGEQIRALRGRDAMVILFSVSGTSPNLIAAARTACELGIPVIAIVGGTGIELREYANHMLVIPSTAYGPVEDIQLMIAHALAARLRDSVHCVPS